jgi:NAD(P)H-hydrate epimerase
MLLGSTAMRELEARAFASGVLPDALMEEAGLGIARAVRQFFPWPGLCLVVFGKGNNGGDALVAARHLLEAGWDCQLVPAFPEADWGPQVREKYRVLGGIPLAGTEVFATAVARAAGRQLVVLDGLLGTGSSGPLRGSVLTLTQWINQLRARSHAHVFALDLPTGLDGDTGAISEGCVMADTTLTIAYAKNGLVADAAANLVGRIAIVPLAPLATEPDETAASIATPALLSRLLARRSFNTHKGDYGRVGIVAGSPGFLGAAVLSATACLRAGAGLVSLYSTPDAAPALAAKCPPEIMVHAVERFREVLDRRHDVLAIGPGLGRSRATEIRDFLTSATVPVIVDADALNALAEDLQSLGASPGARVLTPHPGEMERLAPGSGARDRREAAEQFAARFPACTLLLKGARTIVAKDGEPLTYNSTGTPGMAVGGMGDVLTGVIAALAAQQLRPSDAARLGAWLCGRAAEVAISHGGETEETLTPSRLLDFLPRAFRDLRMGCF